MGNGANRSPLDARTSRTDYACRRAYITPSSAPTDLPFALSVCPLGNLSSTPEFSPPLLLLRLLEVYTDKYDAANQFEKTNCRVVVGGHRNLQGIHYDETYAPTIRFSRIEWPFILVRIYLANGNRRSGGENSGVEESFPSGQGDKAKGRSVGALEGVIYARRHAHPVRLVRAFRGERFAPCI